MMPRVSKAELAERLALRVVIADDLTESKALDILLYGWKKYRHYGAKYCHAIEARNWLYIVEVIDFSDYAQLDLTIPHSAEECEGE